MEFSERKKDRTKSMWNQSGAVLKESSAKASEKKVPEEYRGHQTGEVKKTVPFELRRLEHTYGSISIGVNQKDQMVVLMNRKTAFQEGGLTESQKGIRMERAHQEHEGEGRCYMDSFDRKEGAVAWAESKKDSPEKIWKQLKAVPEREGQVTAGEWIGKEASQIPETKRSELFRKIRRNLKEAVQEARRETEESRKEFVHGPFLKHPELSENEDGIEAAENSADEETGEMKP